MPFANEAMGEYWNDTMCVEVVDDPNLPGEPCTVQRGQASGFDDCDATSMCWDVNPKTNMGTCVEQCMGTPWDPTCPDPCSVCTVTSDLALFLCFPQCDPIVQDCPVGAACYPGQNGFSFYCAIDESPPGTGIGSPCEFVNLCPPGLFCVEASVVPDCQGIGCCTPVCANTGADPCPGLLPGTECVPWLEDDAPLPEQCIADSPGFCTIPPT
ncbi:MAG: hypothetical protein K0V04_07395 [Deltaproteobacteria bacterium]|nr:hypothetical protein [Deltaproteobacteria bacterium]